MYLMFQYHCDSKSDAKNCKIVYIFAITAF